VLPVIDFSGLPDGKLGVKTGAKIPDGSDATIDLDMDSPLIRAKAGWVELDLFGIFTVSGSIAFELGPTSDVILTDAIAPASAA
jgi:hypothetical protein